MTKLDFILVFPLGICGEKTISVHESPVLVASVAAQVLKSQSLVFGDLCIIKDDDGDVWAIEYWAEKEGEPNLYTQDSGILTEIKQSEGVQ